MTTLRKAAAAVMEQLKHGWVEERDPVAQDLKAALEETVLLFDGMTPQEFVGRELYEFQEATGYDTAGEYKASLPAKPVQEPVAIDGAMDRLLINIKQPEAYVSFGWTYQPDMWAHVDKDNNVTHLDMELCAEGPRNAYTALAIAIWNKAIEEAAKYAVGDGDDVLADSIRELKK